jgi:hypothetical protein
MLTSMVYVKLNSTILQSVPFLSESEVDCTEEEVEADIDGKSCIDAEDDDIYDDYVLSPEPQDLSLSQAASEPRDKDEDAYD